MIRLLIMDVDGTLTDGKVYLSDTGEMFKAFDIKDGYGIKHILPQATIRAAIITGRTSKMVALRAKELGVNDLYQGIDTKVDILKELKEKLHLEYSQIAYIGDDLNDLPVMKTVGLSACPSDAVLAVKRQCNYVCQAMGGHGAVREFIEWLVETGK